jgi:hypothetical protein
LRLVRQESEIPCFPSHPVYRFYVLVLDDSSFEGEIIHAVESISGVIHAQVLKSSLQSELIHAQYK